MTPEQERLLHHVAGTVERIDERTEAVERWSTAHEAEDAKSRASVASLLESRVQAKTAIRVAVAIGVSVASVIGWLVGHLGG